MAEKQNADGAWIFVSHSHMDLKKVREIRDILEREGHNPLLFYLKCLEQNDLRLPKLIRDEIKARSWFVLCDSENARQSPWVQEEMQIVKAMPERERFYVTIDLSKDIDSQRDKLMQLSIRATGFMSYSHRDNAIATQINRELKKQDYRVRVFFDRDDFNSGSSLRDQTVSAIQGADFMLLLLSSNYLASRYCTEELRFAFEAFGSMAQRNIIPLIVQDRAMVLTHLPPELQNFRCIDMTDGKITEKIKTLIGELKQRSVT